MKILSKDLINSIRDINGFPLGKDQDIISLSEPPYYTACPNPFISEFIMENGKTFEESNDTYHREPLATDVIEGKNDPIYNAHFYHTKVPYKAIMQYILHYTEPGDIVYDGFCGTGMTGVAAQMCEKADLDVIAKNNLNKNEIKLGARKSILMDLAPIATFIAYNLNNPVNSTEYQYVANRILKDVEKEYGWMYKTDHILNGNLQHNNYGKPVQGIINYIVWSDVYVCPQCSNEITYWEVVVNQDSGEEYDSFSCPFCNINLTKNAIEKAWLTKFDADIRKVVHHVKQVPVMINYSVEKKRFKKKPDKNDIEKIDSIENMAAPYWYPSDHMPEGVNTEQPKKSHGIDHVHHFYTRRNLIILSSFFERCMHLEDKRIKKYLCFWFTSMQSRLYKLNRYMPNHNRHVGPLSGTLYISHFQTEISPFYFAREKLQTLKKINHNCLNSNRVLISLQSSTELSQGLENKIDYIFTDPPFGGNLMYSELNFIIEAWLKVFTNNKHEAIINKVQKKSEIDYESLMLKCFASYYKILKPGRWITIVFHNTRNYIWNIIQESLIKSGFIIADVRILNKKKGTTKQLTFSTTLKEDLVVSAYKPKEAFVQAFTAKAGTEDGVWEFVKHHLEQLPIVVVKEDMVEVLAERQNYMLFDRMVAFHLENGYNIPVGAVDFYQGLHERFPERDSMYFLPKQILQYEQKRAMTRGIGQLSLYVQDERTAIQWTRSKLEEKRQTLQELTPQFLKEVNYVRWEKQLELSQILNQNFLQDDTGYWYVPDHNKQADLEKLREKALLKEFELYKESKGKLKVFRTEAVRAGFKDCWKNKDFQAIVKIGQRIPEAVIQEDSSLLMYYNNALTRSEG